MDTSAISKIEIICDKICFIFIYLGILYAIKSSTRMFTINILVTGKWTFLPFFPQILHTNLISGLLKVKLILYRNYQTVISTEFNCSNFDYKLQYLVDLMGVFF